MYAPLHEDSETIVSFLTENIQLSQDLPTW